MKILIISLFLFFNINNSKNSVDFHDAISATFNVIERGHVVMLEIDFDTFNFLKLEEAKSIKVTKEDFVEYLNKTTSWEINSEKLIPEVLKITSKEHHTKVICLLAKSNKNIKSIKIKNEFLLNIKTHSNIIALDLNDTFKDFRLYEGRREIEVDYN